MQVGDLVRLHKCESKGKIGVVTILGDPSYLGKNNPALRLYWVLFDKGVQCFTGGQLEVINEKR